MKRQVVCRLPELGFVDRRENVILLGPPAVGNWLVAARLVGGRVAKPITHSSAESNTRLGVRPTPKVFSFRLPSTRWPIAR